jgi:hypothetical protein
MKELYRSIIKQAAKDLCGKNDKDRMEVVRWMTGEDFEETCVGADVKPELLKKFFVAMVKVPLDERKSYSQSLISVLDAS